MTDREFKDLLQYAKDKNLHVMADSGAGWLRVTYKRYFVMILKSMPEQKGKSIIDSIKK